jgi:hypothetical protein
VRLFRLLCNHLKHVNTYTNVYFIEGIERIILLQLPSMVLGVLGQTGARATPQLHVQAERTGRGRVRDRPRTTEGRIVRGTPSRNDHAELLDVSVGLHENCTLCSKSNKLLLCSVRNKSHKYVLPKLCQVFRGTLVMLM